MNAIRTIKDRICINLSTVHYVEKIDACDIGFNFGGDDWKNVTYETINERDAEWEKLIQNEPEETK